MEIRLKNTNEVSDDIRRALWGEVLKSAMQMLNHVLGGCPKRKICGFYDSEYTTCIFGPYRYCGKYRSIEKSKTKIGMSHEII